MFFGREYFTHLKEGGQAMLTQWLDQIEQTGKYEPVLYTLKHHDLYHKPSDVEVGVREEEAPVQDARANAEAAQEEKMNDVGGIEH